MSCQQSLEILIESRLAELSVGRLEGLVRAAERRLTVVVRELGGDESDQQTVEGGGDELARPYAILRSIYQHLTDCALALGKPLLDVRVLLYPRYCRDVHNGGGKSVFESAPVEQKAELPVGLAGGSLYGLRCGQFERVAIGGTFDCLHAGHKLMLSTAVMLAQKELVCGVTGAGRRDFL